MPVARSHNYALRKAYFSALTGITYEGSTIPVYSEMAIDEPGSTYIVFSSINNTDDSPKSAVNMDTTVQVSIFSSSAKYNNANAVDAVADEVLQRITANITVDGVQNVSTQIVSDNTQNFRILNQLVSIDRLITFRHKIFQGT